MLAWLWLTGGLSACELGHAEIAEAILTPARRAIDHAQREAPPSLDIAPQTVTAPPSVGVGAPPTGYVVMKPVARSGAFGNAILLTRESDDVMIPIFIGGTEALSIELRLQHKTFTRPLTHDLLDSLVRELGGRMLRAQVNALVDGVFVGSVIFERAGQIVELDARPSDAIALAIGNDVPIYVAKAVIDEAGLRSGEVDGAKPSPKAEPIAL